MAAPEQLGLLGRVWARGESWRSSLGLTGCRCPEGDLLTNKARFQRWEANVMWGLCALGDAHVLVQLNADTVLDASGGQPPSSKCVDRGISTKFRADGPAPNGECSPDPDGPRASVSSSTAFREKLRPAEDAGSVHRARNDAGGA